MLQLFFQDFLQTFLKFLYAPLLFPEMLWILAPVLVTVILMEIYFYKYPRDAMGHHKFLENSIYLIFIGADLLRYVYFNGTSLKIYVAAQIVCIWILIGLLDFLHKLPTSIHFRLSTKVLITYSAHIAIILIYSDILSVVTLTHIISVILSILLFLALIIFVQKIFQYLEPRSYEEIEYFLKNIEDDIKKSMKESEKIVGK